MSDTELKIKVSADGATIRELEMRIKELRAEFKASRIGSDEFNIAAKELKKTLEQKTVAVRVAETENAKLMRSYFTLGNELRSKTNPAFTSLNQIIQDMPFGIRGIGNNVQFLTQQFVQLKNAGTSTSDIFKGLIQNVFSPMGALMFTVSAGTSLLTVAMDSLGQSTTTTNEALTDFMSKFSNTNVEGLKKFRAGVEQDIKDSQSTIKRIEGQIAPTTSAFGGTPDPTRSLYDPQVAKDIIKQKIKDIEANKEILKDLDDRIRKQEQINKLVEKYGVYIQESEKKVKEPKPTRFKYDSMYGYQPFDNGQSKALFNIDQRRQQLEDEGKKYQQQQAEELAQIREDAERRSLKKTEDNLRSAINLYNSVFFSPLKAGFEAIASGSGNMADAFIDSLKRMIVQLIEFAAFSAVLSFIPGMGKFTSLFSTMSGLTSLATPVTNGGISNRSTLSRISSRSMNRGGGFKVQVVGKLGNDAIYLSGNRYLSMNNAAKY